MSAALRSIAFAVLASACANAGNPGSGGDDSPKQDASNNPKLDSGFTPVDTPPPIDAPGPIDAPMADAAADAATGPFCTTNANCTVSGECCVTLGGPMGFCGPGTVIAGQCFPN